MVSSNLASIRPGQTELVSYEPGLILRARTRSWRSLVAQANLTVDSGFTQKFGLYRVFSSSNMIFLCRIRQSDILAGVRSVQVTTDRNEPKSVSQRTNIHVVPRDYI